MASHLGALVQAQTAAPKADRQMVGTYVARISNVRSNGVYVVIASHNEEHEFGPCVIPIGVQGVGPAHVDTTGTGSVTKPVVLSNATALIKGLQVLVELPVNGRLPWLLAIAPTGPGV